MTTIDTEARVALAQSLATTAAKRRRNALAQFAGEMEPLSKGLTEREAEQFDKAWNAALARESVPSGPSDTERLAATERSRRDKLSTLAKKRARNGGKFLPAVIAQTVADDADSIEPISPFWGGFAVGVAATAVVGIILVAVAPGLLTSVAGAG